MLDHLEIRDPVHGFIYRDAHERDIIDTKVFQRLRSLHQLALAHLVYPGATHTRFDHSLGAFHVAGGLAEALVQSKSDQRLIRLAVLLHDIGHGPFGHAGEPILKKHSSPSVFAGREESKIHELISTKIILENDELGRFLSDSERENIVGLLAGTFGDSYLHEIVSGPIDADKQDYLLRDSHFTGVKYGIYDQERLKNTLRVHEDNEERMLAISIDGLHTLEQFVLAKYYMTTQVYRHRIRLITDQMIARAITIGIEEDKIGWLRDLYSYDGTTAFINNYVTWGDDRLVTEVVHHQKDSLIKEMFDRLEERRLFKCILDVNIKDFPDPSTRNFVFAGSKEFYKPLEKRVAKEFGFNPIHVIAYGVNFEPATRTESEIPVLHRQTKPTLFNDESALFQSADQKIREQHFHIYAPVEYAGDEKQKRKKLREYRERILEIIGDLANPQHPLQFDSKGKNEAN
jgi:HD superfamily phosphohydrolase